MTIPVSTKLAAVSIRSEAAAIARANLSASAEVSIITAATHVRGSRRSHRGARIKQWQRTAVSTDFHDFMNQAIGGLVLALFPHQ